MNTNQDETLDNERGEAAEALEELLGPDGRLVNSPNPWEEFLEHELLDVRRLQITYGGPSVHIEVNLSDETGEYVKRDGLGCPEVRVPLSFGHFHRLREELGLEHEL